MDPMPTDQHELIIKLLRENQELLRQTNELLYKHERREKRKLIFKIVWYTILLGIPMIAYYYLYSTFVGLTGGEVSGNNGQDIKVPSNVVEGLIEAYLGQ
jgi:hypothetical protein